jgi:hypothetical protein
VNIFWQRSQLRGEYSAPSSSSSSSSSPPPVVWKISCKFSTKRHGGLKKTGTKNLMPSQS